MVDVSIIIACRNAADYLEECFNSILTQTCLLHNVENHSVNLRNNYFNTNNFNNSNLYRTSINECIFQIYYICVIIICYTRFGLKLGL